MIKLWQHWCHKYLSIFVLFQIMMNKLLLYILFFLVAGFGVNAQEMNATTILNKSIRYHDPNGEWKRFNHEMEFVSERPKGPDRKSTVVINNNKGYFSLTETGNHMEIIMDSCLQVPVGKTCDNVKRTRNYYVYLWGLPMKLKDEGTVLDPKVVEEKFEGVDCYVLRVPYDEDTWFFYIDKSTYAMKAYMFYKDEPTKKGELIYLDEEAVVGDMKIPKKRKWVTTPEGNLLGTDILISSK